MSDKKSNKKGPPFKIIPGSIVKGTGGGYLVCQTDPVHPRAITLKDHTCKYVYVHRVVLENKLGRLISDDEASQIDHKNKDKTDNSPGNLELAFLGQHQRDHANGTNGHKRNTFWKHSPRTKPGHKKASDQSVYRVLNLYFNS